MIFRFMRRLIVLTLASGLLFFFVLFPVLGSILLTNSRFRFPEPGTLDPEELGLSLRVTGFTSADGVELQGRWAPPTGLEPTAIIFVHGLNRSHLEMLARAAAAHERGYGVLLLDLRNHGDSGDAFTTLGIHESLDVCRAITWVAEEIPGTRIGLWGVSMGASTALLAADRCGGVDAVVADSSFLSFEETIAHHFRLIFRLPSFPVADLLIHYTRWRLGFSLEEGDVERAVGNLSGVPILFIAGRADRRMPPELAERLFSAAEHPGRRLLVVDEATHGQAFRQDPESYLENTFEFLSDSLP